MDLCVVGACGAIGRQIAMTLAGSGLFAPDARIQLIERAGTPGERLLPGLAADLMDAHAEDLPQLDLACDPGEICADIVVIALGLTLTADAPATTRAELAAANVPGVEAVAQAIARHGHGEELVLVLTNPVEASVAACCRHLDRRRVVGLGAYLDTMRFRQEIARDLGVRRHLVQGLVLGEHGLGMVPCWSTVAVHGFAHAEGRARIAALAESGGPSAAEALPELLATLKRDGTAAAYARCERWGPALRTVLRPYVTQMCGARTPAGTAETVKRLLATLLAGGRVAAAAQVGIAGEFLGLHGVTGAPVMLSLTGVEGFTPCALDAAEAEAVARSTWRQP